MLICKSFFFLLCKCLKVAKKCPKFELMIGWFQNKHHHRSIQLRYEYLKKEKISTMIFKIFFFCSYPHKKKRQDEPSSGRHSAVTNIIFSEGKISKMLSFWHLKWPHTLSTSSPVVPKNSLGDLVKKTTYQAQKLYTSII